jgi:hypothetical protein
VVRPAIKRPTDAVATQGSLLRSNEDVRVAGATRSVRHKAVGYSAYTGRRLSPDCVPEESAAGYSAMSRTDGSIDGGLSEE